MDMENTKKNFVQQWLYRHDLFAIDCYSKPQSIQTKPEESRTKPDDIQTRYFGGLFKNVKN